MLNMNAARIMELTSLILLVACIASVTGSCTRVENRDLLEYSCTGGSPADLNNLPANTEKLRISGMTLPRVTRNTFARFGSNLWVLSCSNCGIAEIESDAFESLTNLQQLSLNSNHLTEVRASWFRGLNYLTYLDLNYNGISKIEDEAFEYLPNLVDFRISGNRLECINVEAMSNLRDLKRIFLNENPDFKCPNAVSKYLEDRDITFEKDPEWSRISNDLIGVNIPITQDSRTVQPPPYYWTTISVNRERPTPETKEEATSTERDRYPSQQRITTPIYRDRTTPENNYEITESRVVSGYPAYHPYQTTAASHDVRPVYVDHETSTRHDYPSFPLNYPSRKPIPPYYEIPVTDSRYPETLATTLPPRRTTYTYPTYPTYTVAKETTILPTYPPVLYPTISPPDSGQPSPSKPDEEEVVDPYSLPPDRPVTTKPQNENEQYGTPRYPRPPLLAERQEDSHLAHNTDSPKIQWSSKADEEFVETEDLLNTGPRDPIVDMEATPVSQYTHEIRQYASTPSNLPEINNGDSPPPAQNYQQGSFPANNTYILQRATTTTDKPLPNCNDGSPNLSSSASLVFAVFLLVLGNVFTEGF